MKHIAQQSPLIQPTDTTPAPFSLEPEETGTGQRPNETPELLTVPPQPQARDIDEWLRRLSPSARAKAQRRRIGPLGHGELDPVTDCPFML